MQYSSLCLHLKYGWNKPVENMSSCIFFMTRYLLPTYFSSMVGVNKMWRGQLTEWERPRWFHAPSPFLFVVGLEEPSSFLSSCWGRVTVSLNCFMRSSFSMPIFTIACWKATFTSEEEQWEGLKIEGKREGIRRGRNSSRERERDLRLNWINILMEDFVLDVQVAVQVLPWLRVWHWLYRVQ